MIGHAGGRVGETSQQGFHRGPHRFQSLCRSARLRQLGAVRGSRQRCATLIQQNGLAQDQVSQVRGFADQNLRKKDNPLDVSNRRITLIVQYIVKDAAKNHPRTRLLPRMQNLNLRPPSTHDFNRWRAMEMRETLTQLFALQPRSLSLTVLPDCSRIAAVIVLACGNERSAVNEKEKPNGNYSGCHSRSVIARRSPDLAVQRRLGILPERRAGIGSADRGNPGVDWQDLRRADYFWLSLE